MLSDSKSSSSDDEKLKKFNAIYIPTLPSNDRRSGN